MKNLILSAAIALSSTAAFASSLRCVTVPTAPDSGYVMTFSPRMDKVLVEQITIAGARKVASLVCSSQQQKGPRHPDQMFTTNCYEPYIRDGGYSAVLRMGGIAGFHDVVLSEVTIMGSKDISHLQCK